MNLEPSSSTATDQKVGDERQSLFHRIRVRAHKRFPKYFDHPGFAPRLEVYRKRDLEDNAKSTPPEDECIDLRCMWAVEFYTPAHMETLLASFHRLGWDDADDSTGFGNPTPSVQRLRESPYGGGWINLGAIWPPGSGNVFAPDRRAPLPRHVKYATGELFSLTSSLTCIVIGFVFDDAYSKQFDDALRAYRHTCTKPLRRGYAIIHAESQKASHVRDIRRQMGKDAAAWFHEYLPGLFSSGVLGEDIPTCEFVSTRQTEPFPARQKDGKRWPAFLSVLDMDHDIDTWRCNGATNLRFAWPPLRRDNERYHAVLAMQENTFDKDTLRGWGEGRDGEIHYVDHMIKGLLSRWALWPMLTGYGRHLNAIRDSATLRSRSRHDAFKVLAALEDHVSYSIDIAAVTADLIPFARESALFDHEVQSFEAARVDLYKNPNFTLIEGLRNWISKRAEWLQKTDLSVRDHLTQYGSLVGAKENVRVQRKLQNLTIVIVILTMVIVVLTLLTFWAALAGTEVAATINEFLNGVFSHSYPLLPAE